MKRCECGCEVWKQNHQAPQDREVPPAKATRDVPPQKERDAKAARS